MTGVSPDATLTLQCSSWESNGAPAGLFRHRHAFASGDTTGSSPPVRADHPHGAIDISADSKIAGERVVRSSSPDRVIGDDTDTLR